MKKILIISPFPPPIGGMATWTRTLNAFYNERKSNYNIEFLNSATFVNNSVRTSNVFRIFIGIGNFFRVFSTLLFRLYKFNPDVIHLNSSGSFLVFRDVIFLVIFCFMKKSSVLHYHFGRIPSLEIIKGWEWHGILMSVRLCSAIIVLDERSKKVLKKYKKNKVFLVSNPLSIRLSKYVRENPIVAFPEKRVIFVGNVSESKGALLLARAYKGISTAYKLYYIGECAEFVKKKIISLLAGTESKVIFLGVLEGQELFDFIRDSTVLVLPSYTEAFPYIILESLALGCHVIASDVGAIPQMLLSDGCLIESGDNLALSNAIQRIIMSRDEQINTVDKRSIAQERIITDYSVSEVARKLEEIWIS